ncbi:hypothetical protein E3P99_02658 [Wallemia hederae]|uniref:Lysophospholipase n=1 Tax=Wallemia hederae TaxID=1540922 RepID=A0A4T0FLP5_9BASI|nr:hypothetical protein E3P99_02658 [Wallemia hederae]
MKTAILSTLALLGAASAFPSTPEEIIARGLIHQAKHNALVSRAEGDLSYAPYNTSCPAGVTDFITTGQALSSNETDYINARMNKIIDPLTNWLNGAGLTYDINQLTSNATNAPKLGIAVSGGGYRAMLGGAGFISALDNRNDTIDFETAGLLQSAAYMSGLSGGSWAVGGFAAQDMTPIWEWMGGARLDENIFWPGLLDAYSYFTEIFEDVAAKRDAGFPAFESQLTDYWGRSLSYHLVADTPGYGRNLTFSDAVRGASSFQSNDMPFPVMVAVERENDQIIVGQNASIWEMTPYQWGTWGPLGGGAPDSSPNGFVDTALVGTRLVNGQLNGTDQCVNGLDNFGFVIGTSATLFNQGVLQAGSALQGYGIFQDVVEDVLGGFSDSRNDVALWRNPFYGWMNDTNKIAQSENVVLVDGGEALENIPFNPHIKPERQVDFVLGFDASADTNSGWPNGTSMYATYNRTINDDTTISFANVPTPDQFVAQGLNTRPTFFGCNSSDVTNFDENRHTPIIAYVPAYPYVFNANQSTFKLEYSAEEYSGMIANGEASTALNGLVSDGEWKRCLACALVDRARERNNVDRSPECQTCFNDWCWNGQQVDASNTPEYEPEINSVPQFVQDKSDGSALIQPYDSGSAQNVFSASFVLAAAALVGAALL